MSFPDHESVVWRAKLHKFRDPNYGESEADYRAAVADAVGAKDLVEGHEIRTGKGWDQWSTEEKLDILQRGGFGRLP